MWAGSYMVLAPFFNPVYLAEVSATLNIITKGKFILGLAAGYRDKEFEVFNIKKINRHRRLREIVEIIRLLHSRNNVEYNGRYYQLKDVTIAPKPICEVPIWIGADTEKAVSLIPEFADV